MKTKNNESTPSKMTDLQKTILKVIAIILAVLILLGIVCYNLPDYAIGIFSPTGTFSPWGMYIGLLIAIGAVIILMLLDEYVFSKIRDHFAVIAQEKRNQATYKENERRQNVDNAEFGRKVAELNDGGGATWENIIDVLKLNSTQTLGGVNHGKIAVAKIESLLQVSKIKKQITWSPADIRIALRAIDETLSCSFDDIILQELIDQIKGLEKYSAYVGYEALRSEVRQRSGITKFVELKKPDIN